MCMKSSIVTLSCGWQMRPPFHRKPKVESNTELKKLCGVSYSYFALSFIATKCL